MVPARSPKDDEPIEVSVVLSLLGAIGVEAEIPLLGVRGHLGSPDCGR